MQIAIDARELCGKPTGVGRYLDSLLTAWAGLPAAAGHQFILYFAGEAPRTERFERLRLDCRRVPGDTSGTVWEQFRLPRALRRDRPDLLFAPAYTAPISAPVPVVLTIHDLSFVAHPEWFPAKTRWRRRLLTTLGARRARRVLTDSEFSRREIVTRLGVPGDRVTAVALGLTGPAEGRPQPVGRQRDATVLFVGSIFNRRHLPELIRAVATLARRRPDVRLEIVGDDRTFPPQDLAATAESAGIGGATAIRSYVSDEALAGLYERAGVFVFLSDYEGFGLTPLEALSYGVPILVGDTPVAREVYGDAAVYVSTTDEAAIAAGIERLLFDETARAGILSRAPAVLQRYSWDRAARETLAVLLSAAPPALR